MEPELLLPRRSVLVGAAAALPLAACAVLSLFRDTVANTNAALGLVLIAVAAAATGDRVAEHRPPYGTLVRMLMRT